MADETILVVDDEIANLQKLRRTFINRYPVLSAASGAEALDIIRKHESIAVIVVDQRMPDMTGIDLLRRTLEPLPDAIRIVLTGFTDVEVLMDAINSCKVFRYIVKPWDPPDLLMTVERGLESYRLTVENARIRKELIRRERLAHELEIARDIQRYILPAECPRPPGYEVAVKYHPAREVGGDLYDFDWDASGRILQIIVGDVSGKSIPAALYGAVFSGQIQAVFAESMSPAQGLAFLNSNLLARYAGNNYVAVAWLRMNLSDGSGLFANAGMPYPYLLQGGTEIRRLCAPGPPLGLMDEATYEEVPVRLEPGEMILLTSDGTTDAVDARGRFYDESRFVASIRSSGTREPAPLLSELCRRIVEFTGDAELSDDITMLALRRK